MPTRRSPASARSSWRASRDKARSGTGVPVPGERTIDRVDVEGNVGRAFPDRAADSLRDVADAALRDVVDGVEAQREFTEP